MGLTELTKSLSAQAKPINVPPALLEYNIQKTKKTNKKPDKQTRVQAQTAYHNSIFP